jgi:hypothetical protein
MGAVMGTPTARPRHCSVAKARRGRTAELGTLLAIALALTAVCAPRAQGAAKAGGAGLVVIPVPASGAGLSYFKLSLARGRSAQAGSIGLRNSSSRRLRVALAVVAGQTLDTLGSAYAPGGSRPRGSARWLRVGRRLVSLAPRATVRVPVTVVVPDSARPGDYLSGISVEALGQQAESARHGVSIASAVRYAIGTEVTVPGPRVPGIRFTGAQLQRQPAGLVFLLDARNTGNVILQGVEGSALIRSGRRVVARARLGPGTFVTASSIAYPVPAYGIRPAAGTRFRITAVLRYAGGIARLDTTVAFGKRQAAIQRQYAPPRSAHGGTAWWKIALLAAVIAYAVATTALLLLRRRDRSRRSGAGDAVAHAEPEPPQG